MFTIENVFEKRAEFEVACKDKMPNSAFKKLVSAKTKTEFLQVIFDNFYWIYEYVDKFGLRYDYVDDSYEGYARVEIGGKWGFIDSSFKEVCELKYSYVRKFNKGFARVKKGKKWGFVDTSFKEVCELKYDDVSIFNEGFARVKKGGKWGKLYPDGREVF